MSEIAKNFRQAVCCYNCKHYSMDYHGDGDCKKFTTKSLTYASWNDVCDGHEFEIEGQNDE